MPCFYVIEKSTMGCEGKIYEIGGIVRFIDGKTCRTIPAIAVCCGEWDYKPISFAMSEQRVLSMLTGLITSAADILFPYRCSACGKKLYGESERNICSGCRSDILFLDQPLCRVCGMELAGDRGRQYMCGGCLNNPPPYLLARSMVRYSAPVQKLVYGLKYASDTSVLVGISEIISQFDLTLFEQCDYVIPVPLHPRRLRQRGLNQSVLLAKLIFPKETQSVLRTDLLIRSRNTVPQTELNGIKRRKNLSRAFVVVKRAEVDQKILCLVDDILTTSIALIT